MRASPLGEVGLVAVVPKLQPQFCLGPESESKGIQGTSDLPPDKTNNPQGCILTTTLQYFNLLPFSYSCFGLAKILSTAENKNVINL